ISFRCGAEVWLFDNFNFKSITIISALIASILNVLYYFLISTLGQSCSNINQLSSLRIGINTEITPSFKLVSVSYVCICQTWFNTAGLQYIKRFWIQISLEIFMVTRVWYCEQMIIQTHFCLKSMICRYPVQSRLDFAPVRSISTSCCRIIGAAKLNNFSGSFVLNNIYTFDKVCVTHPYLTARSKTEKLLWWMFKKIILLDIKDT